MISTSVQRREPRHQTKAKICKNVRLMVYSYLSVEETAKCASMSLEERKALSGSLIARENKVYFLNLTERNKP